MQQGRYNTNSFIQQFANSIFSVDNIDNNPLVT